MRYITKGSVTIGAIVVIFLGRVQGQTVSEINQSALNVPITNQQSVAQYVANYGKEVSPLAGYGLMPWGISRLAVVLLSGVDLDSLKGWDINEMLDEARAAGKLTAEMEADLDARSTLAIEEMADLGRLTGICFAPYPGVALGTKDNKKFQFYFVDDQFMGLLLAFPEDADWQTLLRALMQKYGQPKTLREKHESSVYEYLIYEWENDAGVARMMLVGTSRLIEKLQEEKMEQAKREMEVKKVEARLEGATETEVQLAGQMGDEMMKMLEQQMAQGKGQFELIGISYYSKQIKKYAENKLQQHQMAVQEKEMHRQQEEEKAKNKEAQKLMNDL